jgi:glucoamylase
LHWCVVAIRAALLVAGILAAGAVIVSGGSRADPRTPAGLPGLPAPFLGTAVVGGGGRTAAVDAYGDLVDLRAPGPAGRALLAVPADRQAAGSVPADAAIVARVPLGGGRSLPFWRADSVRQRYVPGTNVLRTVARVGASRAVVVRRGEPGEVRADRGWLARARPLGAKAPRWARAMYRRSLLVLHALTDWRSGAVVAGARDGWAYVWPRDAATVAIALAAAGYGPEAQRVARFLVGLDLGAAARFDGSGAPVPGRGAEGDAVGWVAAAAEAAGLPGVEGDSERPAAPWRGRADYQEGVPGDYLGDAIAATSAAPAATLQQRASIRRRGVAEIRRLFETPRGLVRVAGEPASGLDSAAAWAVRPFRLPALFPAARRGLLELVRMRGRFGVVPSEGWSGGEDPWTAPTAWTAWALAALARETSHPRPVAVGRRDAGRDLARGDRHAALLLMADLRRAATPLGLLPERVDAQTGLPRSTTPLAWSHAFAILALRELWPDVP